MKNLMFTFAAVAAFGAFGGERIVNGLGGDGWSLWLDRKAEYKSDKLYVNPVDAAKIRDGLARAGGREVADGRRADVRMGLALR